MENVEVIFKGTQKSQTQNKAIQCYSDFSNEEIVITLTSKESQSYVCLNRATTIRLVKELKKQIGNLPY
jgi:hypothetical protein